MQTMVTIAYVSHKFLSADYFSLLCLVSFCIFLSGSSCAGHGGSKTITVSWFSYMGTTPVSYLQEFHVTYEGRLRDPKNMENKCFVFLFHLNSDSKERMVVNVSVWYSFYYTSKSIYL